MDTPITAPNSLWNTTPGGDVFQDMTRTIDLASQGDGSLLTHRTNITVRLIVPIRKESHADRPSDRHAQLYYA